MGLPDSGGGKMQPEQFIGKEAGEGFGEGLCRAFLEHSQRMRLHWWHLRAL